MWANHYSFRQVRPYLILYETPTGVITILGLTWTAVEDAVSSPKSWQDLSTRQRHGKKQSTMNRTPIFADDRMARTATLDRLFPKAHIFNTEGKSERLRNFGLMLHEKEDKS
jgi:hypothetical protein